MGLKQFLLRASWRLLALTRSPISTSSFAGQFVVNKSGRVAASRDDSDAQERQRQKAQLSGVLMHVWPSLVLVDSAISLFGSFVLCHLSVFLRY